MMAAPSPAERPDSESAAADPAETLGDVWDLLDALPRATASPEMTATTIDMVAVDVAGHAGGGRRDATRSSRARMPAAAGAIIGSLLAGLVVGRATAPGLDQRLLDYLPVVRHLDLLEEAGSPEFLEGVAARRYPPPRRPPPGASAWEDARLFVGAIESLRSLQAGLPKPGNEGDPAVLKRRRREMEQLSPDERRELEASAERFLALPAGRRRDLMEAARVLADPARRDLLEAARLWHQWVTWRDPADRRDIVDLDTRRRLEWLDMHARLEGRPEGRPARGPDGRPDFRPPREWDRPPPPWDRDDRRRPPPGTPGPPGSRPRGTRGPGPADPPPPAEPPTAAE